MIREHPWICGFPDPAVSVGAERPQLREFSLDKKPTGRRRFPVPF